MKLLQYLRIKMVDRQEKKAKLIWHCLLVNRNGALCYRTKNKKIGQRVWIFAICKKSVRQIWEKLLNTATKTGLDAAKKVVHKTVEATGEFIGNKMAEKIVKLDLNSRNV